MDILDIFTLAAYVALNVDILFQISKIHRTKSSHDLSLVGLSIRYGAILIILVKFWSLGDVPLLIGQALITFTFTTYLFLAVYYLKVRKPRS